MTGYRFCRSDDVPLLVEAHARCNVGPGARPFCLTVNHMKRLGREMNLWTSSCMVAFAGRDPLGVLIAAKREPTANLVLDIAVHPDHRRQGHARHMLTSLCQKMAILEPTLMLAETPVEAVAGRRFLEACGFTRTAMLTDWRHDGATDPAGLAALKLATPCSPEEILGSPGFGPASEHERCWQRTEQSIRNLGDRARGIGIATDRGFEAWLLHRTAADADDSLPFVAAPARLDGQPPGQPACEVLGVGGLRPVPALIAPLLARATRDSGRPLHLPRVHPAEPVAQQLAACGLKPASTSIRHEFDAGAAADGG